MKSDYRIRATRFLYSILPYIEDCMCDINEIEIQVKEYNFDKHRKVQMALGSARIALITSDYVVKWDYDEENVVDIGGCKDEYRAYKQAEMEGYAYLLAETTLVTVNGMVFSIMPRINNIGMVNHKKGDIKNYLTKEEYYWVRNFDKDIHSYNWGIRQGKACLIDYALTQEVAERGKWF